MRTSEARRRAHYRRKGSAPQQNCPLLNGGGTIGRKEQNLCGIDGKGDAPALLRRQIGGHADRNGAFQALENHRERPRIADEAGIEDKTLGAEFCRCDLKGLRPHHNQHGLALGAA